MLSVTVLLSLLALTGVNAAPSLSISLSGADNVKDVDNFSIVTTITNTGDETLKLYQDPRSALSSFPEDTFSISSNGRTAEFVGAKVKYNYGAATNFVSLTPGESKTITHDLALGYNFTSEGLYEIDVDNVFHYQDASGNPVAITAFVDTVQTTELKGNLLSKKIQKRTMKAGLAKRATFRSCSSSQSSSINTALSTADAYVNNAVSYLSSLSFGPTRYTTWFGTYSSSRKNTVLSHFTKIKTSDLTTYTYDCGCNEDYYAYVYPSQFGIVYLCNAFWSAPTGGTDSKAGTIVHESSHFTANGGTQDYVYGQSGAKSLALSYPSRAIMNADSHEYFAENTPSLP